MNDMPADVLTKAVNSMEHYRYISGLGFNNKCYYCYCYFIDLVGV